MVLLPGAHAMLSRRQALVGVGGGLAAMAAGADAAVQGLPDAGKPDLVVTNAMIVTQDPRMP